MQESLDSNRRWINKDIPGGGSALSGNSWSFSAQASSSAYSISVQPGKQMTGVNGITDGSPTLHKDEYCRDLESMVSTRFTKTQVNSDRGILAIGEITCFSGFAGLSESRELVCLWISSLRSHDDR